MTITLQEQDLQCPLCGFDFVHHLSTTVVQAGNDGYEAHRAARGDIISLPMYCENGCKFTILLGMHKGQLKMWAEPRTTTLSGDEFVPVDLPTTV